MVQKTLGFPARMKGATVHVTLERPLDSAPGELEKLPPDTPANQEARQRLFIANHERANSFVLASTEVKASATEFSGSLEVLGNLPWKRVICRASATQSGQPALGVITVPVSAAPGANQPN